MKICYRQYAEDVTAGRIRTGELVRLACSRFLQDLEREDLEFRPKEVERAIKLVSLLKHYTGAFAGKPFVLEGWQQFIFASLLGFYWKGTNRRKYTDAYICVARKNGKSTIVSALGLVCLLIDGEDAAQILLAANSREQAGIDFDMCQTFARQLDPRAKIMKVYRNEIKVPKTHSRIKVVAADASKLDGWNVSLGIVDEYEAAKDASIRDVIKSSMASRERALCLVISTAGFDKESVCYQLRDTCINMLRGHIELDSMFAMIYELDESDDWKDVENAVKANPNLGVTVQTEWLKTQIEQAATSPSLEVGIKTKNLNCWCDSSTAWIPDAVIMPAMQPLSWEDFSGCVSYVGVDLGAVNDLTCYAALAETADGRFKIKIEYFLPTAALDRGMNAEYYREWYKSGYLNCTDGNVTDYDAITTKLNELRQITRLAGIAYDSWNSTQWAIDATAKGLPLQPYSQSIGNFNRPTKEIERLFLSGRIVLDYNPITIFCIRNVILKIDSNGNTKPSKAFYGKKIDGIIAAIQALGLYLITPRYSNSIAII